MCTATLLGIGEQDYILTAAHCFYDSDKNLVGSAQFVPNADGFANVGRIYTVEKVYLNKVFAAEYGEIKGKKEVPLWLSRYDLAVARLKPGPGQKRALVNYGGMSFSGTTSFANHQFTGMTYGYPSDKEALKKYTETCEFSLLKESEFNNIYTTQCDVISGQSGSPVMIYDANFGWYIRGVVTSESTTQNFVTLLRPSDQNDLVSIIAGKDEEGFGYKGYDLNREDHSYLKVKNECKEDLYIATYARRGEPHVDGPEAKGYYVVKAGEVKVLHSLFGSENAYYAQNRSGSVRYAGSDYRTARLSDMGEFGFRRIDLKEAPAYHTLRFTCK